MSSPSQELRHFLERQIGELEADLAALRAALAALDPSPSPQDARSAESTAKPSRRPSRRASGSAVAAGRLEQLLSRSDGATTTALAQAAGGDPRRVLTLLKELEAAGKARRTGSRRSTRWHLVSGEDAGGATEAPRPTEEPRPGDEPSTPGEPSTAAEPSTAEEASAAEAPPTVEEPLSEEEQIERRAAELAKLVA